MINKKLLNRNLILKINKYIKYLLEQLTNISIKTFFNIKNIKDGK